MLYEADESFSTIQNFPRKKQIYTYPSEMEPAGELRFESKVKEDLLQELKAQKEAHGIETTRAKVEHIEREGGVLTVALAEGETVRAQRVIVAIGRTGNYRKLNVPGEDLDKVSNGPVYDVLLLGLGWSRALCSAIVIAVFAGICFWRWCARESSSLDAQVRWVLGAQRSGAIFPPRDRAAQTTDARAASDGGCGV